MLQTAVAKKNACNADIDGMIVSAEQHIYEAKMLHAEFKPHMKAMK